jgi:hypothetical protein
LGNVIVEVVHCDILERTVGIPWDKAIVGFLHFEENLQDGYNEHEREDVQYGGQDIEDDMQYQVFLVRRYKAAEYLNEFFHVECF